MKRLTVLLCLFCLIFSIPAAAAITDGTYFGRIRHGVNEMDVTTTFVGNAGHYRIHDGTAGKLMRLGSYPYGQVANQRLIRHLYEWQDSYGKGLLWVCFWGNRFDGHWTQPGKRWPPARWYGTAPPANVPGR